jgi:hypothetical protein
MSYALYNYKILHLLGVLLLFAGLGGLLLLRLSDSTNERARKLAGLTHGLSMLLILVAGFGTLAKLGLGFPGWAVGKLVIWLLLAAAPVLIRKAPSLTTALWWLLPLLGSVAAALAIYKPGG